MIVLFGIDLTDSYTPPYVINGIGEDVSYCTRDHTGIFETIWFRQLCEVEEEGGSCPLKFISRKPLC